MYFLPYFQMYVIDTIAEKVILFTKTYNRIQQAIAIG